MKPEEILLRIPFEKSTISFLINNSPLTKFHSLIVPDLEKRDPQILNLTSIRFSVYFLLNTTDSFVKIGYNSPGALASVNHLHLHMIKLKQKTFIDNIELVKLNTSLDVFKSNVEDINFICMKVNINNLDEITNTLYKLIKWMIESLIPHNLFFLKEANFVKVFVFAKKKAANVKTLGQVNLAFCDIYEKIYNYLNK